MLRLSRLASICRFGRTFSSSTLTPPAPAKDIPAGHHTEHIPDNEVVGIPEYSPEHLATPLELAAGKERIELLGKLAGRSAFLMEPLKIEKFGTLKEPILVDSVVGKRLVGCTGFPKGSHEPLWFWVDSKEGPMRCADCGQAFRINKLH